MPDPIADVVPDLDLVPGRSCPLHYRYAPASFARAADLECETLYVVGGLYGNRQALDGVLALFERERGTEPGMKRLVFNGDFHWFDTDPAAFAEVSRTVLAHDALRGNVETEIAAAADAGDGGDAGCGCAYPDWVADGVVERSNRIAQRLRATAATMPELTASLAALPMTLRADVGGLRVAVVHGDACSLAGWGFAQELLREPAHRELVRPWFESADVDVFASSHTCAPVFCTLSPMPGRSVHRRVLNNGAAGMPNLRGDDRGLLTRISVHRFEGEGRRFGVAQGRWHMDAIAIPTDRRRWHAEFLAQWPSGSDAHISYWPRISSGANVDLADALIEDSQED